MVFDSIEFAVFLPIVFALFWLVGSKKIIFQNILLVFSSYVFYAWWDWRFLFLIVFSTCIDYFLGILLNAEKEKPRRRFYLYLSVGLNLGLLVGFKYFNFFIENFVAAFTLFGFRLNPYTLNVVLPIGISFYTFQTMSYTIDVYKGRIKATKNFVAFAAFVSFFPQLVAGPIERAAKLLPQFKARRIFEYSRATDGLRQILWGLFKKVVIADNCAGIVNPIFENSHNLSGSTLVLGSIFFTIQIYADFSGYSDIAIGVARLFGFELSKNFSFPYFSRSMPEAWTKWHISLTTWFRDYLYVPIAIKIKGRKNLLALLMIFQFTVIGFWHGANWTYIVWGLFHALFMLPYTLNRKKKQKFRGPVANGRTIPEWREALSILKVFVIVNMSMIIFRSRDIGQAIDYFNGILSWSVFNAPQLIDTQLFFRTSIFVGLFIGLEWLGRNGIYSLDILVRRMNRPARYALYYFFLLSILFFAGKGQDFIYFQF